ncbi:MAG: GNAT family protein [Candidatus Margulisiibacteriota bacterium]|nr:GNAT family protein [Candidatus Margulisiibacteriota bacterium]
MFSTSLEGPSIKLELYDNNIHRINLIKIAQSAELWTYQIPTNTTVANFVNNYIESLNTGHLNHDPLAYIIVDSQSQQLLGSSRYYEISKTNKKCCIGFTWYIPERWGSGINVEVKYLMLSQIFDTFGWNRVGFHVDSRNKRSLAAMAKIGATKEGILKQHKIVQGDFVRDTVQFAITKDDWPTIKSSFLTFLG